jgi:hypothetical protein
MKKRMQNLKAPEMKMPAVFADLVHDLRDRRLLPLVALVLVALVAVPFLLSDSQSDPPPTSAAGAGASKPPELTVVQVDHGLRVPAKRLGHLTPVDPFEQQFTGPAGGPQVAETSTSTTSSETVTSSTTTVETETGSAGSPAADGPAASTPPSDQAVTVFTFAIDLTIVKVTPDSAGGEAEKDTETRERVLPATTLPGKKAQVVTYLGISPKQKRPLFMVSDEVTEIVGEAECVAGAGNCQLLEVEPKFPVTVVYGPNHVRFKFTVLDVEPVSTGHL